MTAKQHSAITNIKYNIDRSNVARCQIPKETTNKIIEFYKENPAIKISEITSKLGISDSVVRRVRRENNLTHLGYMHLIGNNNPKARERGKSIENNTLVEVPAPEQK